MGNPETVATGCHGCILYIVRQDEVLNKDDVLMARIDKHHCRRCMAFVQNKPVMTMKRLIPEREKL
jgi:hypothetical protein